MLRGEGNIGQALFSASLGGTPVQKVVEALQAEAGQLFKGRATTNVSIRPAVGHYNEFRKLSRDAVVNPETWERIERDLAEAEGAKTHLEEDISKLDRELQWITRCEDTLPTVGRLDEERRKLAQLPALPDLAADFGVRARAASKAATDAQAEVQRLAAQTARLQAQFESCQVGPGVLAAADALDQLHQDLGAYRARKKSLDDLRADLAGLEPHLRAGMRNLQLAGDFSSLEGHRLGSPARLACEEAAAALKLALAGQAANSAKIDELAIEIGGQEVELQSLRETDLTELREALAVAAEATDADRTLAASESEVRRLTRETSDQHRQISGAPPDFDATADLAAPATSAIRLFQERMEAVHREIEGEEEKLRDAAERGKSIQAELGRLQRRGELPSELDLREARARRDRGWTLVLAEWKGGGAKEELIPGEPLAEAFPRTIATADSVADELRIHAEAVAQAEEKRSQLREIAEQTGGAQRKVLEFQGALAEINKEWRAEWSVTGITPRSPSEMLEWRDRWGEFRQGLAKLRTARDTLARKQDQIQRAKQLLANVLGQSIDKEYSLLFDAAKKRVQDGEQSAGKRDVLASQLAKLKSGLAKAAENRARLAEAATAAAERWNVRRAAAGLPGGVSPETGLALLREQKELVARFDEWRELSNKAESTARAIADYGAAVGAQAAALGVKGDTIEALESALWKALAESRKAQARRDQLAEQIERASGEYADAQARAARSEQTLASLIQIAGLPGAGELESLLARVEQHNATQTHIDNLRNTLRGLARGQSVDDFVAKVRAENPDALTEGRARAVREKAEKESALPALREKVFQLVAEKKTLEKAGDDAAAYRQQAESCAASLRQDAARFLRLCLATQLLQEQIERFRAENQGPLLQKSGEIFQAITRGAFSGLGAEYSADDIPVLVGVRPDQTKVPVEGLSDGTRDQLYLALRLAALDRYLEEREPMPLILDDLLITFDDTRARAILPQLAKLARRAQILLFTHHEHLVEICRQTLGADGFHLHRLGSAPPPARFPAQA